VELGYALSNEEHTPNDVVRYAQRAEEAGFAFAKARYDHVYVHRIGPNQEGFFRFYQQEVLPKFW
jgi:hypothetical protein